MTIEIAPPRKVFEERVDELTKKQRQADESEYRRLVFSYETGGITDAGIIELAALAEKLGQRPDDDVRAIRLARRLQSQADEVFDFPALEKNEDAAHRLASEALAESLADIIRGRPLEEGEQILDEIYSKFPFLNYPPAVARNVETPDRKTSELCAAARIARDAFRHASCRRPDALREIEILKREKPILWP